MRAVVVLTCALAALGSSCQPKREVRATDAGADAAAVRAAPGGSSAGDGGSPALDAGAKPAAVDAGPPDDALPAANAPDMALRSKHLLEAIVQDNPDLAADILFPRDAFLQSKDVGDPAKVWEKKVSGNFTRDIHTLHRRLKGKDAQLVGLEIGAAITRIVPKHKDFKKPLWRVKHSKLSFTVEGKPQRVEINEMVSWRGAWYVLRLH